MGVVELYRNCFLWSVSHYDTVSYRKLLYSSRHPCCGVHPPIGAVDGEHYRREIRQYSRRVIFGSLVRIHESMGCIRERSARKLLTASVFPLELASYDASRGLALAPGHPCSKPCHAQHRKGSLADLTFEGPARLLVARQTQRDIVKISSLPNLRSYIGELHQTLAGLF